jgi:hypothetical protein
VLHGISVLRLSPMCEVAYVADELQNKNSSAGIAPVCIRYEAERWYLWFSTSLNPGAWA